MVSQGVVPVYYQALFGYTQVFLCLTLEFVVALGSGQLCYCPKMQQYLAIIRVGIAVQSNPGVDMWGQ